jgi:hypothetical protein
MGPNLACAEWLMKNGAKVRCKNSSQFVGHYDFLPTKHDSYLKQFKIEQVYAGTEASISHLGFLHFSMRIPVLTINLLSSNYLLVLKFLKDLIKNIDQLIVLIILTVLQSIYFEYFIKTKIKIGLLFL